MPFLEKLNNDLIKFSNYDDYNEEELLLESAKKEYLHVIKFLLKYITDTNKKENLLLESAKKGYLCVIKFLLKYGTDINCYEPEGHLGEYNGNSVLMNAVEFNQFETAKYLLENGADINYYCFFGYSVLCIALYNGNEKIINLLIENGAKHNSWFCYFDGNEKICQYSKFKKY